MPIWACLMTDFWTGILCMRGVCQVYGKCIPGAVAATMIGATAQAGAWDEFEARCLVPFENHFPVIVDGLKPKASKDAEPSFWINRNSGTVAHLTIELAPSDGELACRLQSDVTADADAFEIWVTEAVSTFRYVQTASGSWASNEWIEPQLAVSVQWDGDAVILRVLETDLES